MYQEKFMELSSLRTMVNQTRIRISKAQIFYEVSKNIELDASQ